jgi:hypothetical protein
LSITGRFLASITLIFKTHGICLSLFPHAHGTHTHARTHTQSATHSTVECD